MVFSSYCYTQGTTEYYYKKFGLRLYKGSVFVHSEDVENTSGSNPFSIEVEYSKRFKSESVWDLCRCYPTTGFLAAYQNYDNKILGNGGHLAYFIQYHFFQRSKISPAIRGTGGVSYNSNPHDEITNPNNQSYSLPINFSLQFAAFIEAQLSSNYLIDINFSFNHISNGGIQQPNKGINWPSFGASIYYTPNSTALMNRDEIIPLKTNPSNWFKRMEIYLSGHSRTFAEKEHFFVFGSEFLGGYYVNNLNTLVGGIEWNFDQAKQRYIALNNSQKTAHLLSFHLGHEFVLGDFRFSQKLGLYLLDQLRENDLVYHKWGIAYLHKSGFLIGIELKAHRHVADIIVGKIGFQF